MRRLGPVLIAAFVSASSSAAFAATEEDVRAQARAEFRDGEAAFERQDYQGALEHFGRAHQLAPHDAIHFNIAVCHERLGHNRKAIGEYQAAASSTQVEEAARRRAREQIARLEPLQATLRVDAPATPTEVIVDGELRCSAPCAASVDPRPQTVTLRSSAGDRSVQIAPTRGAAIDLSTRRPVDAVAMRNPPDAARSSAVGAGGTRFPRALTFVGAPLALVGAGGIVFFGLRAESLHHDYVDSPTVSERDTGIVMRDLANASIAVATVGAAMVLIDFVLALRRSSSTASWSGP